MLRENSDINLALKSGKSNGELKFKIITLISISLIKLAIKYLIFNKRNKGFFFFLFSY